MTQVLQESPVLNDPGRKLTMTKLALDTADVDLSFHVNEDYARRYEERKRKQELGQRKTADAC